MLQYIPFIIKNAFRNSRRSLLTVTSIAVSLALLGTMMALYQGLFLADPASEAAARRLITRNRVSLVQALPTYFKQRIRQIPGVVAVTNWQWFGGIYKEPSNFFANIAVDPEDLLLTRPEMSLPEAQRREFLRNRTSCIVSDDLAKRFNWKINDRISLKSEIFQRTLDFTLVGIFTDQEEDQILFFHWDYLAKGGNWEMNEVGTFLVLVDDPNRVTGVGLEIDAAFASGISPTKTETEQNFALSFLSFLGNLKLFLVAICAAVMFTVLLVSANTVAMSVRERTRETAILRMLGFAPTEIRWFIIAETVFLAGAGGVLGGLLAMGLGRGVRAAGATFQFPELTPTVFAILVGVAVLIGLVSSWVPAYLASRKNVVDSIRFAG